MAQVPKRAERPMAEPSPEAKRIAAQLDRLLFGISALVLTTTCIVLLLLLA